MSNESFLRLRQEILLLVLPFYYLALYSLKSNLAWVGHWFRINKIAEKLFRILQFISLKLRNSSIHLTFYEDFLSKLSALLNLYNMFNKNWAQLFFHISLSYQKKKNTQKPTKSSFQTLLCINHKAQKTAAKIHPVPNQRPSINDPCNMKMFCCCGYSSAKEEKKKLHTTFSLSILFPFFLSFSQIVKEKRIITNQFVSLALY